MGFAYLVPDTDISVNWITIPSPPTNHWSKIDEGFNTPSYTDQNYCLGTESERYGFTTSPIGAAIVTKVEVRFYYAGAPITQQPGLRIELRTGSTFLGQQYFNVNTGGPIQSGGVTFSGLSLNQSEVDALNVTLIGINGAGWPPPPPPTED